MMKDVTFWHSFRRSGWSIVVLSLIPFVLATVGVTIAACEYHKLEVENAHLRRMCAP